MRPWASASAAKARAFQSMLRDGCHRKELVEDVCVTLAPNLRTKENRPVFTILMSSRKVLGTKIRTRIPGVSASEGAVGWF